MKFFVICFLSISSAVITFTPQNMYAAQEECFLCAETKPSTDFMPLATAYGCQCQERMCKICIGNSIQGNFDTFAHALTNPLDVAAAQQTIRCPHCQHTAANLQQLIATPGLPALRLTMERLRTNRRAKEAEYLQDTIQAEQAARQNPPQQPTSRAIVQDIQQRINTYRQTLEADLGYQDPANFIDLDGIDIEEQRALLATYSTPAYRTGRNQRASNRPSQPPTQQVEPYSNTVTAIILLGGISYLTWEFSKDKVKAWWRTKNPAVKRRYKRLAAIGGLGVTTGIGYVIAKKMMLRP